MKATRIIAAAALVLCMAAGFSSCSRKISTSKALSQEEAEVMKTPSQKKAEEKPATRAWGEASNFSQSFAKQYAEAAARNAFARQLGSIVESADKQIADDARISHSDGVDTEMGTDQGTLSQASITQIASGQINNMAVVCTDSYRRKNGEYHVYVCVEYLDNLQKLAEKLAANYKKQLGQQVSDEERAKMEVRAKEFQQEVEKRLSVLNGGSTF